MKSAAQLVRALKGVPLTSFAGALYRVVDAQVLYGSGQGPGYVTRPLYNLGPSQGGARFTPKHGAPAIYAAGAMDTAMRERLGVGGRKPLRPPLTPGALVTYVIQVRLSAVLDVTKPTVQELLGTDAAKLASAWRHRKDGKRPPTHRLGQAVADAGNSVSPHEGLERRDGLSRRDLRQERTGAQGFEPRGGGRR